MLSRSKKNRDARILLTVWLALIALTIGSFWIADLRETPNAAMAAWVLGIASLKAHFVAGFFMDLVHAPRIWLFLMSGFLVVQAGLILALF